MTPGPRDDLQRRNRRVGLMLACLIAVMIVLVCNSVRFYKLYCRIVGAGGQAEKAEKAPDRVFDREITVRFNADVNPNLYWSFKPDQAFVKVKVGQEALVSFTAVNKSAKPLAGTAIYNIAPDSVGRYFNKTQCFCFNYQLIAPGKTAHFPVVFYIDPKIMADREADGLKTLTLSYTFFKADSSELEAAMQAFYNDPKSANKAIPIKN